MYIVITGSTKGIGFALAKEFLAARDCVLISSSSPNNVNSTMEALSKKYDDQLISKECDVRKYEDVEELGKYALDNWPQIDIWINNAGINNSFKPLIENTSEEIENIVTTNSIGTIYGCKVAIEIMKKQKSGHIFNMEGMGSNGRLSPNLATYGMTKNSIPHLTKTLEKEVKGSNVGLHTLSPGMVITDLIIPHANKDNARVFNILAETPETVARYLVPKIKSIKGTGRKIRYLTKKKAMWRFFNAQKRKNRFFDTEGNLL
ncbi:MAG: SDR family oxidoreductase [Candidatus Kariarchaeaceae archaeon]|jgi:chlorophyll(ide) b reductase